MALYAFDGTGNIRDSKDAIQQLQPLQYGADSAFRRETEETNVHRFREFYGRDRSEYLQGVGTRFSTLGRIFGGAFGLGGKWRIRHMYRALCKRYHAGDTDIDIVGFSRGAALAVHFANIVNEYGIRRPEGPRHLAFHYDRMFGWSFRMPKANPATDVRAPQVRFLGLLDTVASFGIPIGPLRNRPTQQWQVLTIPENVRRSFHAMALDEVRATFALIRPARTKDIERHYEVWFRGVHSNIGGGYPDRGLSDIVLAWMMEMYLWTLDKETPVLTPPAAFTQALMEMQPVPPSTSVSWMGTNFETLSPDADGELGRPADIRRQGWRTVPQDALVHHSAYRRTPNMLLDHYRSNRRLLRKIPGDARPVYDPPFFYGGTPRRDAERIATEAFCHIPVRAADWLVVNGMHIVRGDDWLARGQRREDLVFAQRQDTFVQIATEWLLSGRRPAGELTLPAALLDYDGADVDVPEVAQWTVAVLVALQPYVPALRAYRPSTPSGLAERQGGAP